MSVASPIVKPKPASRNPPDPERDRFHGRGHLSPGIKAHFMVWSADFTNFQCERDARPVAQVSQPAVSPTSKSAGCRNGQAPCGFGNPRYSRLGSLRYEERGLTRRFHKLPVREGRPPGSAGFPTCCVADFQVGRVSKRSSALRVWKPAIQPAWKSALRRTCEISRLNPSSITPPQLLAGQPHCS